MKMLIRLLLLAGVLYLGTRAYDYMQDYRREYEQSQNRVPDVLDGMIGRQAVGQLNRIKEMKDQFNVPAFKTTMMMYYSQNGRYPNSMEELERTGDVSREITTDRFGNRYQLSLRDNRHVTLHSAGRDRIHGTTDDVQHEIDL